MDTAVKTILLSFGRLSRKVLFFSLESFMTHSYSHAARTVAHIFLYYVSEHSTLVLLSL